LLKLGVVEPRSVDVFRQSSLSLARRDRQLTVVVIRTPHGITRNEGGGHGERLSIPTKQTTEPLGHGLCSITVYCQVAVSLTLHLSFIHFFTHYQVFLLTNERNILSRNHCTFKVLLKFFYIVLSLFCSCTSMY